MIRSKAEAIRAIRPVTKKVNGKLYGMFVSWLGSDPISGRRLEIVRADRRVLLQEIDKFYSTVRNGVQPGDALQAMNPSDVEELRRSRLVLEDVLGRKPEKGAIPNVLQEFAEARLALNQAGFDGISIVEAVRQFAASHKGLTETTLSTALDKFLSTLNDSQETYRNIIQTRVGKAIMELGAERLVSSIKPTEAMNYLQNAFGDKSEKHFNNNLQDLKTFFNWCARPVNGFCRENPLASAVKKRIPHTRIKFLDVDDTKTLFSFLAEEARRKERGKAIVWASALWFFCGCRMAEIHRLTWGDFDETDGTVLVAEPKGFQHGIPPRFVKMPDAAKEWIKAFPLKRGEATESVFKRFFDSAQLLSNAIGKMAKRANVDLPRNSGRHTFITMHVAAFHDAGRTEQMVGTSSTMRRTHYQGLVKEDEALRYFSEIRP